MKIKYLSLILLVSIFIMGCVSQDQTETSPEPVPEEQPAEEPAEAPPEEEKEPIVTEETYYLPVRSVVYFADGYVDIVVERNFGDDGEYLHKQVTLDNEGAVEETIIYEFSNGFPVKKFYYDGFDKITSYREYEVNESGKVIAETSFNQLEEIQTIQVFEYNDQGQKVLWQVKDALSNLMAYSEYQYTGEQVVRIDNYDASGIREDYFTYSYNDDGYISKEQSYEADGKTASSIEYTYENGFLTEKIYYRANGSVKLKEVYTNDDAGNPLRVDYYSGGMTLKEFSEHEYLARTREVITYQ